MLSLDGSKPIPCGSLKPSMVLRTAPLARSTTPIESFPSSATKSSFRERSTERWSIRPLTGPSGILPSSSKSGVAAFCARLGIGARSASASSRLRAYMRSALGDIDMVWRRFQTRGLLERVIMGPEMHDVDSRLFTDHVVVQCPDPDAML